MVGTGNIFWTSFFAGFAKAFDFSNSVALPNPYLEEIEEDFRDLTIPTSKDDVAAIKGDWYTVGYDIRKVLSKFKGEQNTF